MVGNAAIADYLVARVAVFVGNTAQPAREIWVCLAAALIAFITGFRGVFVTLFDNPDHLEPFLAIDFADGGDNQMIVVLKNPVAKGQRHIVPWHS